MTGDPAFYEAKARVLAALAHPVRLEILDALAAHETSTGDLGRILGLPQPLISQHLAVLRAAGVVRVARQGHQRIYRLADDRIADACGLMGRIVERLALNEGERLARLAPGRGR